MRRYSMARPKPSRIPPSAGAGRSEERAATARATSSPPSFTGGLQRRRAAGQPRRRAVGVALFLPDGQPALDGLDDPAADVERVGAVGAGHGDGDADLAHAELPHAVNHGDVVALE